MRSGAKSGGVRGIVLRNSYVSSLTSRYHGLDRNVADLLCSPEVPGMEQRSAYFALR